MKRLKRCLDKNAVTGLSSATLLVPILTVASIAAGVFIDTSNELKTDAEDTVEQALKDISTYIDVRSIYGIRKKGESTITKLYMDISLGPGSPPINLSNLVIYIDDQKSLAKLEYHDGPADSIHYNATPLIDPDNKFENDVPRVYSGTTVGIKINLSSTSLKLKTHTICSIRFTPRQGSPITETFTTPNVYSCRIIHLY